MEALTPRGAGPAPAAPDGDEPPETLRRQPTAGTSCPRSRRRSWVLSPARNGAAARLGMKRSTLQFRMRKLGIERPGTSALVARQSVNVTRVSALSLYP